MSDDISIFEKPDTGMSDTELNYRSDGIPDLSIVSRTRSYSTHCLKFSEVIAGQLVSQHTGKKPVRKWLTSIWRLFGGYLAVASDF